MCVTQHSRHRCVTHVNATCVCHTSCETCVCHTCKRDLCVSHMIKRDICVSHNIRDVYVSHMSTRRVCVTSNGCQNLCQSFETLFVPRSEETTKTMMQGLGTESALLRQRSCDARACRIYACTGFHQTVHSTSSSNLYDTHTSCLPV